MDGAWHPDPTGRFRQRYHDGTRWTEHVITLAGAQGTDPLGVEALDGVPPAPPAPVAAGPSRTNGMAIASLVLGILWLWWIGSVLALVFGFIAKRQIDDSLGQQTGRGMATAGIVLGFVGVGTLLLMIVVAIGASS